MSWLKDVVRRMINQNSKPNVKSYGERIKDIVEAGKAERYVVYPLTQVARQKL